MLKVIAASALLLLTSCDGTAPRAGADGYTFGQAEYSQETFTVVMVQYDSQSAFEAASRKYNADKDGLEAFGLLSRDRLTCEIHILRVATNYRPEWLGHEVTHCMHGRWHP